MKYPKAKVKKVVTCPDCGFVEEEVEDGGMPPDSGFSYGTDKDDVDYVVCPCGCKFLGRDFRSVFVC